MNLTKVYKGAVFWGAVFWGAVYGIDEKSFFYVIEPTLLNLRYRYISQFQRDDCSGSIVAG